MLKLEQLPPMPTSGEGIGSIGPVTPPSVEYAIKSYIPYLVVLVVMPLVGVIYNWIRTIYYARKKEYIQRPDNPLYSVYLLAGLFPLIGGAAVLYKIVLDYVYGRLPAWRWISSTLDLYTYQRIAEFLSNFYLVAGLVLGLSILLILLYKYYDNWYIDLVVYVGVIAWFLYLTPLPLKNFKYTTNFMKTYNITFGSRPFDSIENLFYTKLLAGFILGAVMATIAYVYYIKSLRKES